MVRHRRQRDGVRVARRVAVGQEEEVAEDLRGVAEAVDLGVPEALRDASERQRSKPGEEGDDEAETEVERGGEGLGVLAARGAAAPAAAPAEAVPERRGEHERRDREDQTQRDRPAALPLGRRHLGVHDVAGIADEPRIALRRQVPVRVYVQRVADVGRIEGVRPSGRPAQDQRDDPVDRQYHHDPDAPHEEPDQVGDDEDEAEEDRDAGTRPVVIVADSDPPPGTVHGGEGNVADALSQGTLDCTVMFDMTRQS
jgi:hypothetical protein